MFSLELDIAKNIAREAGKCILEMQQRPASLEIRQKQHNNHSSFVTNADLKSHEIISDKLKKTFPSYGFLSEEMASDDSDWRKHEYALIIDPLDGTANFIGGGSDYGIHIGLIKTGTPVLGVHYYPAKDLMYWAVKGEGAYKKMQNHPPQRLLINIRNDQPILSLQSKTDELSKTIYEKLELLPSEEYIASTGLRLCLIAEGKYNLYITSAKNGGLWDFASGEAIIKEAGGIISDWQGLPIDYRNPNAKLLHGVIACGNQHIYEKFLACKHPKWTNSHRQSGC